uniref:Uncharacterized protein n=1 Tax=Tanacetum cinerariifolium TaxID=118510 RepID=A0A6L2MEW0_TANCI|nr:hypothetical protein [Tanacetum cinerariifolium]
MRDTVAQTRSEGLSKVSNDSLLAIVNTPRSDEDRMKHNELMELCTNLQNRVLNLETTKTTQALEIDSLKRRVKKLEKKQRLRTHKLKRLYKVGLTARVESSADESSLGDDASKQGRKIQDIDADEGITLVDETAKNQGRFNDQENAEMLFDVTNELKGEEVFVSQKVPLKEPVVDAAQRALQEQEANIALNKTWDGIQAKMDADYQLVEKLQAKEQQEAKLVMKSLKKAEAEVTEGSSKRAGEELEQESSKKQKIDEDKETAELKQLVKIIPNKEGVAIEAIPLAVKPPSIVDWKVYKEGKKSYYQIIRADGSSKKYLVFSHMLKEFDREDVETLWKLVKAKRGSKMPEEGYERVL